jgi:hypothetical protein
VIDVRTLGEQTLAGGSFVGGRARRQDGVHDRHQRRFGDGGAGFALGTAVDVEGREDGAVEELPGFGAAGGVELVSVPQ